MEGFNPGPPRDIPLKVHLPEDDPLECCKHTALGEPDSVKLHS